MGAVPPDAIALTIMIAPRSAKIISSRKVSYVTVIVKRVVKTIIRAHWILLLEVIPPVTSNATILLSRSAPITMGAAQRVVIPSQIITANPFVEITY